MANSAIKTGEGGRKGGKFRWKSVLLFILVVALAGGAGVGLRWLQQYREDKLATKPDAIAVKTEEAQNLAAAGDYDKAHAGIDGALDNPQLSPDARHDLLFQRGVTYENQEMYDEAIEAYKEAEAIKASQRTAEAIARTAEAKGDKQLAIDYYKKAKELAPADNPMSEGNKEFYDYKIKELGGQ